MATADLRARPHRRLGGDASLNAAIREDGDSGEWQDWLVDESPDQETTLAASEEFDNRRKTRSDALTMLNKRERRIFETRRLAEEPITLVELAEEFGVSRERVQFTRHRDLGHLEDDVAAMIARARTSRGSPWSVTVFSGVSRHKQVHQRSADAFSVMK